MPFRHAIKTAEDDAMKHVTIRVLAVAAAAMLAMPASAQMGTKRGSGGEPPKGEVKAPVDEKAYKAALERIPAPKEKYDPWGVVAPAPAAPVAKKK
jgi:hypothetical protein